MKCRMKNHGFMILGLIFMLVLMSVTAIALNRRSALQNRMAANQARIAQISLGQVAATEHMLWQLTQDPYWRTGASVYSYGGTDYECAVQNASLTGYTDAITLSTKPSGATSGVTTAIRYYLTDLYRMIGPAHIARDAFNNVFIADWDGHSVWKIGAASGTMTRVAGTGSSGYSGDGGPATQAMLNSPRGVAVDAIGVIYIADTGNHRIRKVDLAGNISTVAGTGTAGYWGDNGPATSARLNGPRGVFVDSSRNIYIADTENCWIRKVDGQTGIIDRVAGRWWFGGPLCGYTPDVIPPLPNAKQAMLDWPHGVFKDTSGEIYVTDTNNHRIRRFIEGGDISTVAGTGIQGYAGDGGDAVSALLNRPRYVYVDATSKDYFIADTENHVVRKVYGSGVSVGQIYTLSGTSVAGYSGDGGPATDAQLDNPYGVLQTTTGAVWIADRMNACIREIDPAGFISTVTGTGTPSLNKPQQIAMDGDGRVYIADMDNNRIRILDSYGGVTTVAGTGSAGYSGDGGPAVNAELNKPEGVAVDGNGHLYIADTESHRIRKIYMSGVSKGEIYTIAGTGVSGYYGDGVLATSAQLNFPKGIHVDSFGNIFISDTSNCRVRKILASGPNQGKIYNVAGKGPPGGFDDDNKPATAAKLNYPEGVFPKDSGQFYIADTLNHRIRMVDQSGTITTVVGTGLAGYTGDGGLATSAKINAPRHIFMDSQENLYLADTNNHVIRVVDHNTNNLYTMAGTGVSGYNGEPLPAINSKLQYPSCAAGASTWPGRKLYISDGDNNRIRILEFRLEKRLY